MPTLTAWECDGCGKRLAEFRLRPGSTVRIACPACGRPHRYRTRPEAPGWAALTHRQRAVVALVCRGRTNPEIGDRLGLARATVKVHLATTFERLGVRDRSALAYRAGREGWLVETTEED